MAKHKAIYNGDILQFELIDNCLTSKPECKAIVLSCSSLEDYEKFKANPLYDKEKEIHLESPKTEHTLGLSPSLARPKRSLTL